MDVLDQFLKKKQGPVKEDQEKIRVMLEDPEENYNWAEEMLTSIYDYTVERGSITPGQMQAVDYVAKAKPYDAYESGGWYQHND